MKKSDKPIVITELTEKLKKAKALVVVDFNGLTVKKQQDLKKELRAVNAEMAVVKNTLLRIAAKEASLPTEISDSVLEGPSALVIGSEDPIAPIQVLAKFAKANELPSFKVGVVEGNFQDKAALTKLATLPSKDVLSAQVVGAIAAPMYGIVSVLNANMQKLVYILKAKVEQSSK